MLFAYRLVDARLERLAPSEPLAAAVWIDLYRPQPEQSDRVLAEAGVVVPTLEDMEEIEISSRLYREGDTDVMTIVISGARPDGSQVAGPVTFILTPRHLVSVRHHAPRPFETYPGRADRSTAGCGTPLRLFVGLIEEIIARQADITEASGRALDALATRVYAGSTEPLTAEELEASLRSAGREGEVIARVRLGLLTIERMLSVFGLWTDDRPGGRDLRPYVKSMLRDIQALEEHADFLSGRVGLATDTTLGMVNLAQNQTVRILSVVAALFLPPTLIASVYGMNFDVMPELGWLWGYPMALGLMALTAVGSWAYFKWKGWV